MPENMPLVAIHYRKQFKGIPYLVVLDKEGNIIEKNLRGETLDKKLKEIFGF
jgi:hypothetical protein